MTPLSLWCVRIMCVAMRGVNHVTPPGQPIKIEDTFCLAAGAVGFHKLLRERGTVLEPPPLSCLKWELPCKFPPSLNCLAQPLADALSSPAVFVARQPFFFVAGAVALHALPLALQGVGSLSAGKNFQAYW